MEELARPISLDARRARRSRRSTEGDPNDLVVAIVTEHAESLLRVARRYTSCAADADDAYQRALEIFVKSAHRLDPAAAHKWLHVVVRNEALAVRRARSTLVGVEDEGALDALDDGRSTASVEERSERFDDLARAAEALQRLKPQEVTALWLKAQGLSYQEIAERQGWSYTKVNRCITEGRRAFLTRYARIAAGEECERWSPVLSAIADGEATPKQLLDARPHLRNCPACRSTLAAMRDADRAVAGLLPPVGASAGGGVLEVAGAEPGEAADLAASLHDRAAAFAASLHERASTAALKLHAAVEAGTTLKLAAVAASAVALAGGGIAVERGVGGEDAQAQRTAPAALSGSAAPSPATPGLTAPDLAAPDPSGRTRLAAAATGPRSSSSGGRSRGGRDAAGEAPAGAAFAPEADEVRQSSVAPPDPGTGPSTRTVSPSPRSPVATTSPRPPAPSTGDGGEFGLVPDAAKRKEP